MVWEQGWGSFGQGLGSRFLLTLAGLLTLEVLGAIGVTVEGSVAKAAGGGGFGWSIV